MRTPDQNTNSKPERFPLKKRTSEELAQSIRSKRERGEPLDQEERDFVNYQAETNEDQPPDEN